jgi:hypothetical protein
MKLIEKLLIPITIAVVGGYGSYIISHAQIKSAEKIADAQISCQEKNTKSDQQIKVLDIFFEKITVGTSEDRRYAIKILSFVTPDLAKKLSEAVINEMSQNPEIRKVAVISYNQIDEVREKQYNLSLSDSTRKMKVAFFKDLANKQFDKNILDEALGNYEEVLKISPEDEDAKRKIENIRAKLDTKSPLEK